MERVTAPPSEKFPDIEELTEGLTTVLNNNGSHCGHVNVANREPIPYASTFPCEIVNCRTQNGIELTLFCKYTGDINYTGYGHRGMVERELAVYEYILKPVTLPQAKFYGGYSSARTGHDWLVLEYLKDGDRVTESPSAMPMAAEWIARFHAESEKLQADEPMPFLKQYDVDYYLAWVDRTVQFALERFWHERFPWLGRVCERAKTLVPMLVVSPQTVIHGEYYPNNVLYHRGQIKPVDWESAAWADGVIDLATLTEGWEESVRYECELAYQRIRWPEGQPSNFARMLDIARMYTHFRWLGDNNWETPEDKASVVWRLGELQQVGEQL